MIEDKYYMIDPLTSICKLALIYFMPEKTKLAISNHVLHIQEYYYCQWFERMKNGDTRTDISYLHIPFTKAIRWYIIKSDDRVMMDTKLYDNIIKITGYAVKGLIKMQNTTYQNDITVKIVLQYFINMFHSALTDDWDESKYIKLENDTILSNKIKNNFESHTINSIAQILTDADKIQKSNNNNNNDNDVIALINCAHKLLSNRDIIFVKTIKNITTS